MTVGNNGDGGSQSRKKSPGDGRRHSVGHW
jgi:hypothetical protein